jgi:5-methylcytosine-specific restriction endonuclease McrA
MGFFFASLAWFAVQIGMDNGRRRAQFRARDRNQQRRNVESYIAMNRWNIPEELEQEVLARDTTCVYCGLAFTPLAPTRGAKPSWEHIINDAKIITRENIARCCMSCNASKGAKELAVWLQTSYCQQKGITQSTVAEVVRNALLRKQL